MNTGRLRDDLRVVVPAWIVARVLVAAGFVVAYAAADHLAPDGRPTQLDEGLLSWDGSFYRDIAEDGYGNIAGDPLRFFPLFPLVGRLLSPVFLGDAGIALIILANALALVVGVLTRRLVLLEKSDRALADRAVWLMMLLPPAFVLVFAYTEALFLSAALASFLALRQRWWWWAALFGAIAALARPFGIFLVLPAAAEVWRHRRALSGSRLAGAAAAVLGPVIGTGLYLLYTGLAHESWLGPLRTQTDFRGDFVDPVSRLARGVGDVLGDETFGDGLHLPFALAALALLVLTFRYWPASYGLFAAAIVVGSISADNLNSLERYALNAFPVVLTLAVLVRRDWLERSALIVSGGGLVAFTTLALLGAYVP